MMAVLVVVAVIAVFAAPVYNDARTRARLKGATTNLFTDLQYARSEAVQRNATISVSFVGGASWCYGITEDDDPCDCGTANSCTIKTVSSAEYGTGVALATTLADYRIDPRRGQVVDAGGNPQALSLTLSAGADTTRADVNAVGRVRLCSSTLSGYAAC